MPDKELICHINLDDVELASLRRNLRNCVVGIIDSGAHVQEFIKVVVGDRVIEFYGPLTWLKDD